jgi:hypothetical protein
VTRFPRFLAIVAAVGLVACQSKSDRQMRIIDEHILGPDIEEPLPEDRGEEAIREAFWILNR